MTASPISLRRWPNARILTGLAIFALVGLMALAPGLFNALNPLDNDPTASLRPPGAGHLLGTDNIGRDIWTRIVHGAHISLGMGLGATLIAAGFGTLLGIAAGLAGKRSDGAISGFIDVLFAFPDLLLALLLITVLGTGPVNTLIAIGIGGIPGFARLMRAEVRRLRQAGFVASSRALGIGERAVLWRHLLPNATGPVLVLASLHVGKAIIYSSALSFLGLGPDRPAPEWGLMLADAQLYLPIAPWMAISPGLAIMVTAAGSVLIARGLRRN